MSRVAPRDSAAQAASAVAESVRYQGRKASRQGSEQRRQAILDAAMRLIVRDGVRAVRHRAVAAEAQVPLSATTYYFKDTTIHHRHLRPSSSSATQRRCRRSGAAWRATSRRWPRCWPTTPAPVARWWNGSSSLPCSMSRSSSPSAASTCWPSRPSARRRCSTRACANWPMPTSGFSPSAPCISPRCSGSGQLEQDAKVLTSIILQMEYQGLVDGVEQLAVDEMRAILRRYPNLVMGL